jgi:chromosome segregation ATPase
MDEMTHKPVQGHSTNPRAEPTSIAEWQTWAETLQTDMEAQAEKIQTLEVEQKRLQRALTETEHANNDTRLKNGKYHEDNDRLRKELGMQEVELAALGAQLLDVQQDSIHECQGRAKAELILHTLMENGNCVWAITAAKALFEPETAEQHWRRCWKDIKPCIHVAVCQKCRDYVGACSEHAKNPAAAFTWKGNGA